MDNSFYSDEQDTVLFDNFLDYLRTVRPDTDERKILRMPDIGSREQDEIFIENKFQEILMTLGAYTRQKGFKSLREAVKIAVFDEDILFSMMKKLYPAVAEKVQTTVWAVERNMRNAVNAVWDRCNVEVLNKKYGINIFHQNYKMAVGEFISALKDIIKLEMSRRPTL